MANAREASRAAQQAHIAAGNASPRDINIVDTNELESTQGSLRLPEPTSATGGSMADLFAPSDLQRQADQEVAALGSQFSDLFAEFAAASGTAEDRGQRTLEAEQAAGITEKTQAVTDITNQQIEVVQRFRREQEALATEAGLTRSQRQARTNDITRRQNMELADIAIQKFVAENSLSSAQAMVDRKLELQFADEQARINNLKTQLDFMTPFLSKAQERAWGLRAGREQAKLSFQMDQAKSFENTKLSLMDNAMQRGAPQGVIAAISQSESVADAMKAAGRYGVSLDSVFKNLQIAKLSEELSQFKESRSLQQQGVVSIDNKEAAKLNKELRTSDQFLSLEKLTTSLNSLNTFKDKLEEMGVRSVAGKQILDSSYTTALVNLKDYFNLGVLNGPDLDLLKDTVPDPTMSPLASVLDKKRRRRAIDEGIENLTTQIETSIDARFATIFNNYSMYNPSQVTGLKDASRIYLDTKSSLNEDVASGIQEMRNAGWDDLQIVQVLNINAGL